MYMKKWLCLMVAVLLALGSCALAESDDLQARLDEAEARIAELEAEVEKYRPYYDSQVLAEYGEDGIIWLEDAQKQFEEASAIYAQYGIPMDAYAGEIKQSIVEGMVRDAVLKAKADVLGLSQLDEDTLADLNAKAAEDLESYVQYYIGSFSREGATDEENREATLAGLSEHGYTQENMLETRIADYVSEQLHNYVTADVTVDDADIQAEYEAMVADDQEQFTDDDRSYNSARTQGETIAWNPEGYRAVKHVLVKFSDDQTAQYNELQDALTSLNDELAALDNPEEAEAAETEEAEAAETGEAEEVEPARSREEIQADIGAVSVSIEALYSELLPRAQEVIDAFNGGEDFDSLIEKYGEDPGMTREPTASQGYAVCKDSTYWDPAFTEGAMAIAEAGQISEPVRGRNGIHIIYYMNDITPGAVPFEEIREGVEAKALETKISNTYNDQVSAWVDEANVTYHLDRF